MSLVKSRSYIAAIATCFALAANTALLAVEPQIDAHSRWATFEDADSSYFALSVQADPTGSYPSAEAFEVVVVMDTSASQTGPVRRESLEVLDELARAMPSGTKLALLACDVDTVKLSEGLVAPRGDQWEFALKKLNKRIPLGTTNLGKAFQVASEQFSGADAQRSIVYIGDGVNRTQLLDSAQHRDLIKSLVDKRISVSSLAIGPIVDVANLATFANQTGGILLARDEITETMQSIGRNLGLSCTMPVVWIEDAQLPAALQEHFPQQFPPLRIDRDTVIVGKSAVAVEAGKMVLKGQANGQAVSVRGQLKPEASHPDMGFLALVTDMASKDGGLTLPALGSEGLRAMSYVLADSATSMVKSGRFALKAGDIEGAIRIAEEALKSDPSNAEAITLLNAARKQSTEEAIPTGKFTQVGGSPYNGAGDLLAEEQARKRLIAQALEAEVNDKLRSASELMSSDPIGVKNSLKLLMEELDSAADIDATLRAQLRNKVGSAIKLAATREAQYIDRVQQAEVQRAQADQAQRLLAETNRKDESLKQLVEQFNFLMASQRYREANKDVQPVISDAAPHSKLDYVTREESSLAANYALVRDAFEAREQGFVDVMTAVEEAAVPFAGDPPVVYPPPEVWQALTAARKERYGAINLAGGNDSETSIYAALKQSKDWDYPGTPLNQVIQGLADDLTIPIWINEPELDLLGIDTDTPINLRLPSVTVRSALRIMLEPLELTYIIRNEVLEITSIDSAESDPINKVYLLATSSFPQCQWAVE